MERAGSDVLDKDWGFSPVTPAPQGFTGPIDAQQFAEWRRVDPVNKRREYTLP